MHINNIIIGGGLSGLLSAWYLQKQGIPYLLLEAKPKLGGRILGVKDTSTEHYHDLGPTWIFPHQFNIQQLLEELNIPYVEQYTRGDALFQKQGNQGIIRTEGAGAASMYRVIGGMTTIINVLYSKIDSRNIKTEHVVTNTTKVDDQWIITAQQNNETKSFHENNLILALPPRMIVEHLTPIYWASSELIEHFKKVPTWMAAQAKFISIYHSSFWREKGLSGQAFSQQGPMQEMHDACSIDISETGEQVNLTNALFGFIGVPANHRQQYDESQIKEACLNQLNQLYENSEEELDSILYKDWATDEFVASARDINEPPKHPDFPMVQHMTELTQKNIFLAGSEFSRTDAGYLEGAVCAVNDVMTKITNTDNR